eukprot:g15307.t1
MAQATPLKGSGERGGPSPEEKVSSNQGSFVGDEDAAASAAAPLRGIRRAWSSIRGACTTGSTLDRKFPSTNKRSASAGTETMSPPHNRWPGGSSPRRLSPHPEAKASSSKGKVVVPECGIKPGMERTIFESKDHGFRLHVQGDSVPAAPPGEQNSGPITVAPLERDIVFEGGELEGVLEVHCLPTGRRFDAPLLLDFLVEPGDEDDPIMDQHGRIRYEVLTRACDSDTWVRDPESSIPLEVVKGDWGRVYVRARVRHFCFWGCWKRKRLDFGPQLYHTQKIPWSQRKTHRSLIKNNTPGVDIHVYAMQMSQWSAALESVKAGAGAEGFEANFEITGDVHEEVNPVALIPQMVTIPSGHSHWFEIPRVGGGVWSSRKAAVVIVTETSDEKDGRRMRMEAMEHLRSRTMLTVTLRVENGRVIGSPCAAESGGILSQVNRVIQNQVSATSGGGGRPSSTNTEARSRSETNSVVNETGSPVSSASNAGVAGAAAAAAALGTGLTGALPMGSPAMADSDRDEESPGTAAVAGAAKDRDDDARVKRKEITTPVTGSAARDTPAAGLARVESDTSYSAPPAELCALSSPVE